MKTAYTWSVDTLRNANYQPNVYVKCFWGWNTESLYAIANVSRGGNYSLMRFDGSSLRSVSIDGQAGGSLPENVREINAVSGTGPSDVWIAGVSTNQYLHKAKDSSYLAHYDGTGWTAIDLDADFRLYAVAVSDDQTVYAGGDSDNIVRLKNGIETHIPFPAEFIAQPHIGMTCSAMTWANGVLYASGWMAIDNLKTKLIRMRFEQGQMIAEPEVEPGTDPGGYGGFWQSSNGTLYSLGARSVFKRSGEVWERIFEDTESQLGSVFGTHDRNLWFLGHGYCLQRSPQGNMVHEAFMMPELYNFSRGWTNGDIVLMTARYTVRDDIGDMLVIGR